MNKIKLLFVIFILSSCFNTKQIYVNSINNWEVNYFFNTIDGSQNIGIYNNRILPYIYIYMSDLSIEKDIKNCNNKFELNFRILYSLAENPKSVEFLKNNKIIFNTSEFYVIKNNKKYKIKAEKDYDYKVNISNMLFLKLNTIQDPYSKKAEIGFVFNSPIGCQALEGATLLIDGLSVNGEPLEPIEIELSYKNKFNK